MSFFSNNDVWKVDVWNCNVLYSALVPASALSDGLESLVSLAFSLQPVQGEHLNTVTVGMVHMNNSLNCFLVSYIITWFWAQLFTC